MGKTPLSLELASAAILEAAATGDCSDAIARLIAELVSKYAWPPHYQRYFRLWEEHGFHLTPVHFYQPIPDTRTLTDSFWDTESEMPGVKMNELGQLHLLEHVFPLFREEYNRFPSEPTDCPHDFYFNNPMFSGTDSLVLYCMVRHFRPELIIEVGSGFSSRISAKALQENGRGRLVSIDPYPDNVLTRGFAGLSSLMPHQVQEVKLETFDELSANDILFIDSSHVVRIGSDVNFLFLEVLPRLRAGVVVHVHDIFFPLKGRRTFVMDEYRFWSEQDMLQAFLAFNSAFEVLFCNSFLARKHFKCMKQTFPNSPWIGGSSFWMRRQS